MISILDYGSGNIHAIATLVKMSNVPFEIVTEAGQLASARKILLPGVGAFNRTMATFHESGLAEAVISRAADSEVRCLGICVGMHVLANSSEEGTASGLGLIPGKVRRFRPEDIAQAPKIPHMGWNTIDVRRQHPLLEGIDMAQGFYFLHSYHYDCDNPEDVIATANHGRDFDAVVGTDRVFGVQFHPEKSHDNGVRLIRNFMEL